MLIRFLLNDWRAKVSEVISVLIEATIFRRSVLQHVVVAPEMPDHQSMCYVINVLYRHSILAKGHKCFDPPSVHSLREFFSV